MTTYFKTAFSPVEDIRRSADKLSYLFWLLSRIQSPWSVFRADIFRAHGSALEVQTLRRIYQFFPAWRKYMLHNVA